MTLGEFISRLFFYIFRIISHYFKRKYDFLVSTYLKEEPDGVLFSYIRNISISSDDFPIEVIRDVTSNYIDHNFDLLGSGWVNVSYGNKYSGLDGHKFDSNFIKFNIKNRINHSNVNSSLKIWSLVDEGYSPIDWQIDFKSGYRWSEKTWSHDVPVGHLLGVDIKVPWELARLQHLPQIALAYVLSKSNPNKLFDSDVYLSEFTNVVLDFIQPGKPTQNSFIERFNRTYRTEVLNLYIFHKLSEVKEITNNWIKEYNEERPHTALGRLTPKEYRLNKYAENSNFNWY